MKIKTWIKYEESFLPPRCRKLRYKECEDYVDIELAEVPADSLELVFVVKSYDGGNIYAHNGKLWSKATIRTICAGGEDEYGYHTPVEALVWWNEHGSQYFRFGWDRLEYGKDTSRDAVISAAQKDMSKYILVDGELYVEAAEPMYCIYTFGLGHNHGGTSLSVDYHYNCNISYERYHNALDFDNTLKHVIQVAANRGDTKDVERYTAMQKEGKPIIEVMDSKYVTHNPESEHGEGNSFLNTLEDIVSSCDSPMEAGVLCMAVTACESSKNNSEKVLTT